MDDAFLVISDRKLLVFRHHWRQGVLIGYCFPRLLLPGSGTVLGGVGTVFV